MEVGFENTRWSHPPLEGLRELEFRLRARDLLNLDPCNPTNHRKISKPSNSLRYPQPRQSSLTSENGAKVVLFMGFSMIPLLGASGAPKSAKTKTYWKLVSV